MQGSKAMAFFILRSFTVQELGIKREKKLTFLAAPSIQPTLLNNKSGGGQRTCNNLACLLDQMHVRDRSCWVMAYYCLVVMWMLGCVLAVPVPIHFS